MKESIFYSLVDSLYHKKALVLSYSTPLQVSKGQARTIDFRMRDPVRIDLSILKTRLTYNCAHLRSTKESLMFEYFDIYSFIRVLCQYRVVLVGTRCYWVIGRQ